MQLFNTLSQSIEKLSFPDGVVRLYVCGITPYDTSHLGHARVSIVYDTLRRYLQSQGLQVRYVQNVTDIDDPLFERAKRDDLDWKELSQQQLDRYLQAMMRLNVMMPDHLVRVTEVVPLMLPQIEQLIELGHGYVRNGAVYYRVASNPSFGAIAHADKAALLELANEMGNDPDDPNKIDPLDFVLWQPSGPGEPVWESAWGLGRPGWHIECSTIATEYLGPQVDIHGGGSDLIFPHHACEIAQAEPVTGVVPFVRYWMHSGMVTLGGTKMSKSLGNMVFVEDLLAAYDWSVLRLAILNHHYRAPFEYNEQELEFAERKIDIIDHALVSNAGPNATFDGQVQRERFFSALADDFDTPTAIEVLMELAQAIVKSREGVSKRTLQTLQDMCVVLGLEKLYTK
jgi:L-cysteine:1D-myo-inositol 2-amino-2-deoxy-alpha-D-glucopyranoside ligase